MSPKTIVVTGASSQIGFFLLPQLLAAGHTVLAVSRQQIPTYFNKLKHQRQLQWLSVQQLDALPEGANFSLVSAGPLSLATQILAKFTPDKVLAISTASIYFKQTSIDSEEREAMAGIKLAEENLRAWGREQQLGVTILRPSLIYGCGLDQNLSRAAKLIERWGWLPVAGSASGLRQPVHAEDIAWLISKLLAQDSLPSGVWPLAGGSSLNYRQMLAAVFTALGKKPRFLPMPEWLLSLAGRLLLGVHPAMISRQGDDLTISNQSAQEQLAWRPRNFKLSKSEITRPTA